MGMQKDPGYTVTKASLQCTADLIKELLQGLPAGLPNGKLLDYWATLSSCLTNFEICIDPYR